MTKAEELKLLDQIDVLIKSADAGDYIPMTFDGVVEVCKRNIENDFGNCPVKDLEELRGRFDYETRAHNETKRQLSEAQKMCKEALDENERLRRLTAEKDKQIADLKQRLIDANAEGGKRLKSLEYERDTLDANLTALQETYMNEHIRLVEAEKQIAEMRHDADGASSLIADLREEIIRLKAELYDYMKGVVRNNG